jgi:hypothetical protein
MIIRHTLVILALWRLRQEECKFQARLLYTARPYLQIKRAKSRLPKRNSTCGWHLQLLPRVPACPF